MSAERDNIPLITPRRVAALVSAFILVSAAGCSSGGLELQVSSQAMEPTLKKGAQVSAQPADASYRPQAGDIVVYQPPEGWSGITPDGTYISRIVGVPGSTVKCCDGQQRLQVDGKALDEPYLAGRAASAMRFEVRVPQGRLWIMGDNRDVSLDSRSHRGEAGEGTIALSDVVGVIKSPVGPGTQ